MPYVQFARAYSGDDFEWMCPDNVCLYIRADSMIELPVLRRSVASDTSATRRRSATDVRNRDDFDLMRLDRLRADIATHRPAMRYVSRHGIIHFVHVR